MHLRAVREDATESKDPYPVDMHRTLLGVSSKRLQSGYPHNMLGRPGIIHLAEALLLLATILPAQDRAARSPGHPFTTNSANAFFGFDRNEYPGDANLRELRKTFAYTGFWLNNPPGMNANTWVGKRHAIESMGFGFLVLFNGRLYKALSNTTHAAELGRADAGQAVENAKREGFPARTIIFLDQEEGGRLLPEQKAYLFAWIDGVDAGGFRAGVYCSGMAAKESGGASVITAEDIKQSAGNREIAYWVTNDACPPSSGCSVDQRPPSPTATGIAFADVWQFAQSPRRNEIASSCRGYASDKNCYAGTAFGNKIHLDLNSAMSPDPSGGRTR